GHLFPLLHRFTADRGRTVGSTKVLRHCLSKGGSERGGERRLGLCPDGEGHGREGRRLGEYSSLCQGFQLDGQESSRHRRRTRLSAGCSERLHRPRYFTHRKAFFP